MKTSVQNVDLSKFAAEFRRKLVYLQLHAMKSQSNSMKDILHRANFDWAFVGKENIYHIIHKKIARTPTCAGNFLLTTGGRIN